MKWALFDPVEDFEVLQIKFLVLGNSIYVSYCYVCGSIDFDPLWHNTLFSLAVVYLCLIFVEYILFGRKEGFFPELLCGYCSDWFSTWRMLPGLSTAGNNPLSCLKWTLYFLAVTGTCYVQFRYFIYVAIHNTYHFIFCRCPDDIVMW